MAKRLLFFATREDLKQLLLAVESRMPVDYVRMGQGETSVAARYSRSEEIPNLGRATTDSATTSEAFLVVPKNCSVHARRVSGDDGKVRYFFDQLANPATVTFAPGGFWGDDVLLHGRVATASDDETSQALMNEFSRTMRKSFRKLKAFWIGPEAEGLLERGTRLTISAQTPRELDLTRTG